MSSSFSSSSSSSPRHRPQPSSARRADSATATEARVQGDHLLAALRRAEPIAIARARRHHPGLRHQTVRAVTDAAPSLQRRHALLVVAREHGYPAWDALVRESRDREADARLAWPHAPTALPAAIAQLRSAFEDGYTPEDVARASDVLRPWTGHELVAGWDFWDVYEAGGNSNLFLAFRSPAEAVTFGKLPAGLWDFLTDPSDVNTVDPRQFYRIAAVPYSPAETAGQEYVASEMTEAAPQNFAWRVSRTRELR